ncbi:MAG: GTP pyrophosphokinase family protein [Oscillospiraceae bacterium]|nr:GTP pyrophosphokinase family protein [Oscillospiraceae bacterium]
MNQFTIKEDHGDELRWKLEQLSELTEEDFIRLLEEETFPIDQFFSYYRCAIMEIETKFRVLNEQFSLRGEKNPIEFISSRIKSYTSIMHKLHSRQLPRTLDSIEQGLDDIAGIRVVCSFRDDIYRLAESFLRQDDITLLEKKDYIASPKPNGYRSLHLIVTVPIFLERETRLVKAEVQLRTLAMDFWASVEHKLRYKKDLPPETLAMLSNDLKRCAEQSADWDDKMQNIKDLLQG